MTPVRSTEANRLVGIRLAVAPAREPAPIALGRAVVGRTGGVGRAQTDSSTNWTTYRLGLMRNCSLASTRTSEPSSRNSWSLVKWSAVCLVGTHSAG